MTWAEFEGVCVEAGRYGAIGASVTFRRRVAAIVLDIPRGEPVTRPSLRLTPFCRVAHVWLRGCKRTRLQAKHVPDASILDVIDRIRETEDRWTWSYDFEEDARLSGYPWKVVRAKLASMVRRHVITGCTCGCRGDFERY